MRVLAVKTHAFGDALMCTPAVSALVAGGHSVTVLAGPSSAPVWSRFPGIDGVLVSPWPCGIPKLLAWSLRNPVRGFQRVIHLGSSRKAALWLRFLTGRAVVSGAHSSTGYGKISPAAADYCRIAGVEPADLRPVFPVTEAERDFVSTYTGTVRYAVIAPGGGRNPREFVPQKRWPVERWAAVSAMLQSRGYRVFTVGGVHDVPDIHGVPGVCLAGKLTWGQTAALVKGASLFCGNDSGPAHLAVAYSVPAMVLFGPTSPEALYPGGSVVPVRVKRECAPCYSNSVFPGCPRGSCMEKITVEEVLNTLEGIISR